MFAGLNEQGELVYLQSNEQARLLIKTQVPFYCSRCTRPLKICCGSKNKPYFRHINDKSAAVNESKIHLMGKFLLIRAWEKTGFKVEKEIVVKKEDVERRIDIFIHPNLAVEFQCSPLSAELLEKRNNFYRQQGLKSLWILGPRYLKNLNIGKNALKFMQYSRKLGFYLLFLEVQNDSIKIYHHIRKYDWNQYDWISETIPLSQLFTKKWGAKRKKFKVVEVHETKNQLAKYLKYRDRSVCDLQKICYVNGYDLLHLPARLFKPSGFIPTRYSQLALNLYKFLNLPTDDLKQGKYPLL